MTTESTAPPRSTCVEARFSRALLPHALGLLLAGVLFGILAVFALSVPEKASARPASPVSAAAAAQVDAAARGHSADQSAAKCCDRSMSQARCASGGLSAFPGVDQVLPGPRLMPAIVDFSDTPLSGRAPAPEPTPPRSASA